MYHGSRLRPAIGKPRIFYANENDVAGNDNWMAPSSDCFWWMPGGLSFDRASLLCAGARMARKRS